MNVPPEYTNQFCGGPCFKETNLVLNCMNDALSSFLFYNRATVRDVKDTILSGCSSGPSRGNKEDINERLIFTIQLNEKRRYF